MGVHLKYETPEEMQIKIDEYFDTKGVFPITKTEKGKEYVLTDKSGAVVYEIKAPTVAGLSLFLGFQDRQSMYDYKKREDFSCTIKTAVTRIEEFAERSLYNGKPTGAIFWLKNHGWIDKQEIKQTNKDIPTNEADLLQELRELADDEGISVEELIEREGLK